MRFYHNLIDCATQKELRHLILVPMDGNLSYNIFVTFWDVRMRWMVGLERRYPFWFGAYPKKAHLADWALCFVCSVGGKITKQMEPKYEDFYNRDTSHGGNVTTARGSTRLNSWSACFCPWDSSRWDSYWALESSRIITAKVAAAISVDKNK